LRNEIQRLNDNQDEQQPRSLSVITTTLNNEQKYLIEELDKKLYEVETERTSLIVERERLKTNYDLCIDEKQDLIQQKLQINNQLKQSKLRILSLQDQIYKLKQNNHNKKDLIPILTLKRRIIKKKPKKSCLEMLLDQNATLIDDLHNESFISNKQRQHSCSLCDHQTENSFIKPKRRPSISRTKCSLLTYLFS
jgi:predicted nuclease with TOPRIM domain